jgi:acyl-CoA thioester hydrolase
MIPIEHIQQLPVFCRATIPDDYIDALGHMSFPYYLELMNKAWWALNEHIGTGLEHTRKQSGGIYALQHYLNFLAEVFAGDEVALHFRLVGQTPKRIHYLFLMVNETQGKLALISEGVGSYANLQTRRTAEFPLDVAQLLSRLLVTHQRLKWAPPLCGVLSA